MPTYSVDTEESMELYLNQIKTDTKVIDVKLVALKDYVEVSAHRLFLSARSEYFRNKFTSSPECKKLEVNDVNGKDLKNIINYCYTGIIELEKNNVDAVMATANRLKLRDLIKACSIFMDKEINAIEKQPEMNESAEDDYVTDETLLAVMINVTAGRTSRIQKYSNRDEWTPYTKLEPNEERRNFGVTLFNNELITAGGYDGTKRVNSVKSTNLKTNVTKTLIPMEICRSSLSLVVLDNVIYAVGGLNYDGDWLKSVESWSPGNEKWTNVADMIEVRRLQRAAVLNGKIYVISSNSITMECYDPHEKSWTLRASMHDIHKEPGFIVFNDYLYVIEGFNNNTVERYNPKTNKWDKKNSSDRVPRGGFGVIVMKDRIIAAGGNPYCAVEEYDPKENAWTLKSNFYEIGHCVLVLAKGIS